MQKRRDFLRATLVAAGALLVPGCGGTETQTGPERTLTNGEAFFPQSVVSGDPRPESVILWTRVEDPDAGTADASLELEVSLDADFKGLIELDAAQSTIKALAKFDHCAKVKLTGLAAGTVHYYRFIYKKGDKLYVSHVGRTKTAPAPDSDVPVKFAYVSCQDFIGRYFNVHLALGQEELDFFVHLGDYIYETTGDPSFQNTDGRAVKFTDEKGAITLGSGDGTYFAASSLDNYRQLYKAYRSDKALQGVHEKFAMIATWDDHEYSNDNSGALATYFDGKKDENDQTRAKNARQAWFEYMPVDYVEAGFEYDAQKAYPSDISIYRDFVFGKHVHLVMTDLRSYRTPPVIPGDAFPGTVVVDQAKLTELLGSVPSAAGPYVDIESYQGGLYKQALIQAAATAGFDAAKVTGKISVAFINSLVTKLNAALPSDKQIPLIDETAQATMERGIAYLHCGKQSFYSSLGSRYLVVKDAFDIVEYAAWKADPKNIEVMGSDQEKWFLDTMTGSKSTWKVWGNEYCLTQIAIDLSPQPVPPPFNTRFYINVDDWDGYRSKRNEILSKLSAVGNVVAVTGDIHAFFAATPFAAGAPEKKIVEFVGSSVTSGTFMSLLLGQVKSDPTLSMLAGAEQLAMNIDALMLDKTTKINPDKGFSNSVSNGYVVVEAGAAELVARYNIILEVEVKNDYTGQLEQLNQRFKRLQFKTIAGGADLYQDMSGKELTGDWKKWDSTTQEWV
ncbi:Phosphodiesterase/alkaline phosphatase D [Minicystis rosea]|nr:Phosphodiesterase/alkaline phosphatase D [Minicystis rosea]